MKCPYCQYEVHDGDRFCTNCGAPLPADSPSPAPQKAAAAAAANTGLVLGAQARKIRMETYTDPNDLIGVRTYNAIIGVVLIWGLFVNVLLCTYAADFVERLHPAVFLVAYPLCASAGVIIAGKSSNPVISFIGYNLVVVPFGLVITVMVNMYGGLDSSIVRNAFLYTLLISLGMAALSMIAPNLFAKLGGALISCLFGLIICEVLLLMFHVSQVVTDWIAAGLFSLYIGYDIYRAQQFPKTVDNAVDSALDIYLDAANLFLRLLRITGKSKD